MPTEDKSHSPTGPRPRVTDTHGPFRVGEFRVLRVGGIVALHLGTPRGRFVFHVSERSFVEHARGDVDGQGNPFRAIEAGPDGIEDAFSTMPESRRRRAGSGRPITPVEQAAFEALVDRYHTTRETYKDLCAEAGVSYFRFMNWKNPRAGAVRCAPDNDGMRPPVLKPGGKLL